MSNPFDSAWAFLKAPTFQSQLNTPSLDSVQSHSGVPGIGERMWYKQKHAKNPIRLPEQPKHLRDGVNRGFLRPEVFEDNIEDEIRAEQRHRKALDRKEQFKQHLNQYIPRLSKTPISQTEDRYNVKVGPKLAGRISVEPSLNDPLFPQYNHGSIIQSELVQPARRQGLYGRALQSIIDDTGKLRSEQRNINSQPFHEQFKPVNATKTIRPASTSQRTNNLDGFKDIYDYTAKPSKETPREFGDLQYDTGALPIYPNNPTIYLPTPTQQQILDQYTYIPVPGGVTYGRR
jgi:hypothetical protein